MKCYVISVSLGTGCYRHIQIRAHATLNRLSKAILSAFDFEDDHAHAFFMDNHIWSPAKAYFSMKMDLDDRLTTGARLEDFRLKKGDSFKYLFDFGDEWVFQCKFLRETDDPSEIPRVIRRVGESPEQYPDYADMGYDDMDDDERYPEIYEKEQVEELYDALPVKKKVVKLVRRYCEAASHLYGIVPLGVVLEIYNQHNVPLSQEDFVQITEVMRHEANDFIILGAEALYDDAPVVEPLDREIISVMILNCGLEEYYRLAEMQEGKEFVVLPKERFLAYEDPYFLQRTPQSDAMLRFLKRREAGASFPAEDTLNVIRVMIWLEAPTQDILDGVQENSIRLKNEREFMEFIKLLQDMSNNTRKIANRGQTPEELRENMRREAQEKKTAKPVEKEPKPVEKDPNQISLWGEGE